MQPDPRAAALLWDAVTFARNVRIAVADTSLEAYLEGGPVTWATERQVELVGEALTNLRKVDPGTASRVPDIHKIIGMRNVLVHGYAEVNNTIVWLAANKAIPALIPVLEALLDEVAPPSSGGDAG